MPLILDPMHRADVQHPFADLARDPARLRATMVRFERILQASFAFDAMRDGEDFARRINTAHEQRRRAQIMAKWYRTLRSMGHSTERSLDDLARALRCELDGEEYRPPPRGRVWTPGGDA